MMIPPLSQTLTFIKNNLPPELIDPECLARIAQLGDRLPHAMTGHYLECRLASGDTRVDWLCCATAFHGGRKLLAQAAHKGQLPESEIWAKVAAFCERWADRRGPLWPVPLIWLEFDHCDQNEDPLPGPGFHYCLDPSHTHLGEFAAKPEMGQLFQQLAEGMRGFGEQVTGLPSMGRILNRLPDGIEPIHVSVMASRQPAVMKLNLKAQSYFSHQDLREFLKAIEWPGDPDELWGIFPFLDLYDNGYILDLTLTDTPGLNLGFALSQDTAQVSLAKDTARLLDLLVDAELCDPGKAHALRNWPGRTRVSYDGTSSMMSIDRWLDIKIVYTPSGRLQAKGYLGFLTARSLF